MTHTPDIQRVTHFEQFANGLDTLREDLIHLNARLRSLSNTINAPRSEECAREEEQPSGTPDGLYYRFCETMEQLASVRDDIERNISALEESF